MRPGRGPRAFLIAVFVPAVTLVAALPLLSAWTGAPLSRFTRDVFSIAEIPVWSGLVSNVGLALWTATATAAGLAAAVSRGPRRERAALGTAGVLSFVLLVDDAILFHEFLAPDRLGIPETVVTSVYVVLGGAWALAYRAEIAGRRIGLLAVAVVLLAGSLGMDHVEPPDAEWWRYWVEESLKLVGIAGWFAWTALFAADALRTEPRP